MNRKIQDKIDQSISQNQRQGMTGRLGVVTSYNPFDNTASIYITKEQTNELDEHLTKVMCPVMLGIQYVAPRPGDHCWVVFKNGKVTEPLITHFFNHRYDQFNYGPQNQSTMNVPSYIMDL